MPNIVAIVGRPNVGKSTLFNRLTESRQAIVDETAGVTRDRHYGKTQWNGIDFSIIDTGGYIHGSDDIFEAEIRKQVQIAIDESTTLLFLVDVNDGVTDFDKEVAMLIRRSKKKTFLVANKVDNHERIAYAAEFYALGLGDVYTISAISGSGTGELLDDLVKSFPEDTGAIEDEGLPKIAVVGRPNVGKSSLTNALLGEERNIVTPIAGTTRDTINTRYNKYGYDLLLVDTAGMRKKAKVHEDLEFYSVMRTIKAIESCDVAVLLIDATQGIESQDMNIIHLVEKNHKGLVIVVNKWDLIEKDHKTTKKFEEEIAQKIAPFKDVPIIFTSVVEKQRIMKVIETAMTVYANKTRKIPTRELIEFFVPLTQNYPPPAVKGKFVKINYVTQIKGTCAFVFFCNLPQYLSDSYKRFLENKFREHYDFTGVPLSFYFRKKN
ncbi:MAG: ribosome biogenesis GTPase Der [Bacteroidetes bacterium]|nr:ribosome biogenesis GTPase Der [Bacteroidota bacterium]